MSLYKTLDKEIAKLEDPKVLSVKLQKDPARPASSFRSTLYNVASHRGIKINVENIAPCIYEVKRKLSDERTGAFEGELKVSKDMQITTFNFSLDSLAASIIFLRERIISRMEFVSYGTSDVEQHIPALTEMGLLDSLADLKQENTENSLILRVKTEFDRLAEPDAPHQTPVSP